MEKETLKGVSIENVSKNSPSYYAGIRGKDTLLKINGHFIMDILDYEFYTKEIELSVVFIRENKKHIVKIHKDETEDLGMNFETYLMDKHRTCKNNCIFCFIDQMPSGMRESLYFKDDDSRLSFLFGNYITLTNLTQHEIDRIISMKISPINVSIHATNPELRSQMMNNRFAGEKLKILDGFVRAGIEIQAQLVLCPGVNDGEELDRSIEDLEKLMPNLRSVAAVPVGITKFRNGLHELRPYTKKEAEKVVNQLEKAGDRMVKKFGKRTFYPGDEFYLIAERELPHEEFYEDFYQLENGVGMMTLTKAEFERGFKNRETPNIKGSKKVIATGTSALAFMKELVQKAEEEWGKINTEVIAVENDFFGHTINVSGLVTGQDLIDQFKEKASKDTEILLIPNSMLRHEGDLFLDDISVDDVEKELCLKLVAISNDGQDILEALFL